MGRKINTYDNDITPQRGDKVVGSSTEQGTANFQLTDVGDFLVGEMLAGVLDKSLTVSANGILLDTPIKVDVTANRYNTDEYNDGAFTLTNTKLSWSGVSVDAQAGDTLLVYNSNNRTKVQTTVLTADGSSVTYDTTVFDRVSTDILSFFFIRYNGIDFGNLQVTGLDAEISASVAWGSLTGTPPGVSTFNNDANYITIDQVPDNTTWANLPGKPSTFPPSAHTHVIADITDFTPGALATQDNVNLETQVTGIISSDNLPDISISNVYADDSDTLAEWITANPTADLQLGDTVITLVSGTFVYVGDGTTITVDDFEQLTIPQDNATVIDGQELAQAKTTLGIPDTFAPVNADKTPTWVPATDPQYLIPSSLNSYYTQTFLDGSTGKVDKPQFSSAYDTDIYDASVPFVNDAALDTELITNSGIHRIGTAFDLVGHWEFRTADTAKLVLGVNVSPDSGDMDYYGSNNLTVMHWDSTTDAVYYNRTGIDTGDLQAVDEVANIANIAALQAQINVLGAPTRGAVLPAAGTFGQRFYVDADYNPDPILTQITTSGGTDLILDGYVPAAGGSLIGLDFRVTLGDDGRATNADSIGNLLGALPMNVMIGDTLFTVTATNPSGPGSFGNTATTTTGITGGDFSAFNYLIGENVFRSTAQPAVTQGWYAFSDQWDSISN